MSTRQKMSPLQVMENLFETDDGISSEDEGCIKDELSWYESDPKIDALSDSNSETDGSDTKSEDEDGSVSKEVQVKDGYLWRTEPKTARKTPGEISSEAHQVQRVKDLRQTRP